MARVDIVIPLYNKAACVGRAIRSIQAQTVGDWRLIVVDDGSTDNGPDVVRGFDDRRIEMIRQENAGPGAARNAGIAKATAKYIAFLDADDEWYPWYLKNALDAIESNEGVAVVGTMYYEWPIRQDTTRYWAKRKVYPGRYSLDGSEDPVRVDWLLSYLHVDTSLMLTEVARKYDGYYAADKCICGEDTVFFIRVGINEDFLAIGPPAVRHHREDSSLSDSLKERLSPIFVHPETVLDYCPAHKRELLKNVLAHMALRRAHTRARHGFKSDAVELLQRFPEAKSFTWEYYRCLFVMTLSRWYPHWVKFKWVIARPIRICLARVCIKLGLLPAIPKVNTAEEQTQDS